MDASIEFFLRYDQAEHPGPKMGEIVIEIDQEAVHEKRHYRQHGYDLAKWLTETVQTRIGNGGVRFEPTDDLLRSRILAQREMYLAEEPYKALTTIAADGIPGQCIHVDIDKRIGRITDASGWPDFADKRERLVLAARSFASGAFLYGPPIPQKTYPLKTDPQLWAWLFWMRRIVDQGCATSGTRLCRPIQYVDRLPTLDVIIASRKAKLPYGARMLQHLAAEWKKRAEVSGQPAKYSFNGCFGPEMFEPEIAEPVF
jgi:hypothetical protein